MENANSQPEGFTRADSDFFSRGTRCSGWLYLAKGVESPPVVIMAHGFAAEKTFGLAAYAERFVEEGIAVYVFDYRCFGDSDGEPRNLVNPSRHCQDWKAAIVHVRNLPEIDHGKIALWGTSFSGGHVIVTAAQDPNIAAIISQVPHVDPFSTAGRMRPKDLLRSWIAASRDVFRLITRRRPYYIPVVGDPGSRAFLNTPDAKPGYFSIIPEGHDWRNECPARTFFTAMLYRPIAKAKRVRCPALVVLAEKDSLVSPESVERAAARMENARLVRMPVGHFDVYTGDGFNETVELETDFLKEHLINAD